MQEDTGRHRQVTPPPKHKIEQYSKFLMSKISWDLTISDINITWVKQTLDSVSSSFVRKWLEIPINGTLDIVTLSKEKFGLNIIKISTKYLECQATKRNCLKKSPNPDINYLHQATAQKSIQVDQYKDASDVTKSVRANQIETISNDLKYQGYIVKQMWTLRNEHVKKLWIDVRDILPSNIYNFTNRYMNNTLATLKNMVMWGKATMDTCLACKDNSQSLLHVVSGCKVHLQQGRYTWRHNSILATRFSKIEGLRDLKVFADIPGYPCPTIVTGTLKRPDVIIVYQEKIKLMHNFKDTVSPMCPTNDGIEDTEHFLLLCPSFDLLRRYLLAGVSNLIRPFAQINSFSNSALIQLLLYGDKDLSDDINKDII